MMSLRFWKNRRFRRVFKRTFKIAGLLVAGLLLIVVLAVAGALVYVRSDAGEAKLTDLLNHTLAESLHPLGLEAKISALSGPLPSSLHLKEIILSDRDGTWLKIDAASLKVSWSALLHGRLEVDALNVDHPQLFRTPLLAESPDAPEETSDSNPLDSLKFLSSWPDWLPALYVRRLSVERLELGPDLVGEAMVLSADGTIRVTSGGVNIALGMERLDKPGAEFATLAVLLDPSLKLTAKIAIAENRDGYLLRFLPPDLATYPILDVSLEGSAPLADWTGALRASLREGATAEPDATPEVTAEATPEATADVKAEASGLAETNAENNTDDKNLVAELTGEVRAAWPMLPRQVEATLTASTGDAANALWKLAGQENGKATIKLTLNAVQSADQPANQPANQPSDQSVEQSVGNFPAIPAAEHASRLQATASLQLNLEDMRWGDERLTAALGPTAELYADLSAEQDARNEPTTRLTLSGLRLNAGALTAKGNAAADLVDLMVPQAPDATPKSHSTIKADISVALANLDVLQLDGVWAQAPLELRLTAAGPLTHPDAVIEFSTALAGFNTPAQTGTAGPASAVGGNAVDAAPAASPIVPKTLKPEGTPDWTADELRIRLASPALDWGVFLAATDSASSTETGTQPVTPSVKAHSAAGTLTAETRLTLAGPGGNVGNVTFSTNWELDKAPDKAPDTAPDKASDKASGQPLHAALRNLQLNGAGLHLAGLLEGTPFPPALTGKIKAEVTDWKAVAAVAGIPLDGEGAELSVDLLSPSGGQTIHAAWNVKSLELRAVQPASQAARQKPSAGEKLFAVRKLQGDAVLEGLTIPPRPGLKLKFSNETGALEAGGIALAGSKLTASGPLDGPLRVTAEALPLTAKPSGQESLAAKLDATWRPGRIELAVLNVQTTGSGKTLNARLGIRLTQGATVIYGLSGQGFSTSGMEFALLPSGKIRLEGSLSAAKLNLKGAVTSLDLAPFRAFVPALPSGKIQAETSLSGTPARPTGTLAVRLDALHFPGSQVPPVSGALTGRLEQGKGGSILAANLTFTPQDMAALGATEAKVEARVPLLFSADGVPGLAFERPLEGSLHWKGALGPLWNFLPLADRRLTGGLTLAANLTGTLRKPRLAIDGSVINGEYQDLALGILLRNIQASLVMAETGLPAELSGGSSTGKSAMGTGIAKLNLSADDGLGGKVSLGGNIDLTAMSVSVKGALQQLKPLRRQDLRISLSGDVSAQGPLFGPDVSANIIINEGELRLDGLSNGGNIRTLDIAEASPTSSAPAEAPVETGTLNVKVTAPNRFYVRGRGLESEWKADIQASGPLLSPSVTGSLDAIRGNFEFLNKSFQLARGQISFTGGQKINPLLDIVMAYQAANITADIMVTGSASRPKLTLSSQPALPQDEIISQIMFGQSAGSLGRMEALQLAGAAASLAGFGTGNGLGVFDLARNILGVNVLRLNSNNSRTSGSSNSSDGSGLEGTTLEVGKYITDKVYVGVSQGVAADSTGVLVEIELTPRINVEARTASTRSEVGVQWKYDY